MDNEITNKRGAIELIGFKGLKTGID